MKILDNVHKHESHWQLSLIILRVYVKYCPMLLTHTLIMASITWLTSSHWVKSDTSPEIASNSAAEEKSPTEEGGGRQWWGWQIPPYWPRAETSHPTQKPTHSTEAEQGATAAQEQSVQSRFQWYEAACVCVCRWPDFEWTLHTVEWKLDMKISGPTANGRHFFLPPTHALIASFDP